MSETHRERLLEKMAATVRPAALPQVFNPLPEDRGSGLRKQFKRLLRYRGAYVRHVGHQLSQHVRHLFPDHMVTIRTFWGREFRVPSRDSDARALGTLGVGNSNEDPLVRFFIRTLTAKDIFYDVGANYGFYTALAEECIENGEIHAFEPNPSVFTALEQVKRADGRTFLNKIALSDHSGESEFFDCIDADASGKSTTITEVAKQHRWHYRTITVPTCTLDEYTVSHQPPTIMKIDVEGAESAVLEGGKHTLAHAAPTIALELWSGPELSEFSMPTISILEESGYMPFFITSLGDVKETTFLHLRDFLARPQSETNFVFRKLDNTYTSV